MKDWLFDINEHWSYRWKTHYLIPMSTVGWKARDKKRVRGNQYLREENMNL